MWFCCVFPSQLLSGAPWGLSMGVRVWHLWKQRNVIVIVRWAPNRKGKRVNYSDVKTARSGTWFSMVKQARQKPVSGLAAGTVTCYPMCCGTPTYLKRPDCSALWSRAGSRRLRLSDELRGREWKKIKKGRFRILVTAELTSWTARLQWNKLSGPELGPSGSTVQKQRRMLCSFFLSGSLHSLLQLNVQSIILLCKTWVSKGAEVDEVPLKWCNLPVLTSWSLH